MVSISLPYIGAIGTSFFFVGSISLHILGLLVPHFIFLWSPLVLLIYGLLVPRFVSWSPLVFIFWDYWFPVLFFVESISLHILGLLVSHFIFCGVH